MADKYNFDPTGTSSANRIIGEQHVITAVNFRDYHYVIPNFAPFFRDNFEIKIQFPDKSVRTLIEGQDYYLSNQFLDASKACAKPIYGSISFLDTELYGIMSVSYNTVGGMWNISLAEITRILAEEMRNPRITTWEQITDLPQRFPVVDHEWDLVDMVGGKELVESIDSVREAILSSSGGGLSAHVNRLDNPHNVTKAQVGLGNVQNYAAANAQQAQTGTATNLYMTPLTTKSAIDVFAKKIVDVHEARVDNPHRVTKTQVGLGNVPNYPIATDQIAISGNSNEHFMTPRLVNLAVSATAGDLAGHIGNTNNPHHTTKEQVGLFYLENYPIATEQEARDGSSNARYMTPLRTMQLCREFVAVQLDGHATQTNNPHRVDKTQVGLGSVQNYGVATVQEMLDGVSNKYTTPALVSMAVAQVSGGATAHIADSNNPHSVTAEQVGAYSKIEVDNMLSAFIGPNDIAANSRLFDGKTTNEYRDWLRDNLAPFNANTLDGMTVSDLAYDVLYQVARPHTYVSKATGTHTWIKLGWLDGLKFAANDQPVTSFIVSGGEEFGFGTTAGPNINPILVRASFKKLNAQSRPVLDAAYMFSADTTEQLKIGAVWDSAAKRMTFYARVKKTSSAVRVMDISGVRLEGSDEMAYDSFGFEESVTEPTGIYYATPTQTVDKANLAANSEKLGGQAPSYYATNSSFNSLSGTVTSQANAISALNRDLTATSNVAASNTQRIATLEATVADIVALLGSISIE